MENVKTLSQAGVLFHFHHFVKKMLSNLQKTQNRLPHTRCFVFLKKIESDFLHSQSPGNFAPQWKNKRECLKVWDGGGEVLHV